MSDERERLARIVAHAETDFLTPLCGATAEDTWDHRTEVERGIHRLAAERAVAALLPAGSVVVDGGRLRRLVAVAGAARDWLDHGGMNTENRVAGAVDNLRSGDLDDDLDRDREEEA